MKNPVPLKYRRGYAGCKPQQRDNRDIVLGDIPYIPDPNAPSWEDGFDNEVKYGKMKREHQGSSLSCVSQGWSNYAQMLNQIETGKFTDLSARFIYSQIYLPQGGAYIRDGASIVVRQGDALEEDVKSYMPNGGYPDEERMRYKDDITDQIREKAKTFQCKRYVWLDADRVNEDMRQIIWQYGGFVSGYKSHCMYASSYGIKNGKKFIKFINSYGEGSDIYIYEDEPNELYDITFLVDLPNPPDKINMLKIILDNQTQRQYVVGIDGKYRWVFNEYVLNELHNAGVVDKNSVEIQNAIDTSLISDTWAVIK